MMTVIAQAAQAFNAMEGVAANNVLLAEFADPLGDLPPAAYSADINWGDGGSSSGVVSFDASTGVYSVRGSHVYIEDGSDHVTVVVHRAGSTDSTLNALVTVAEEPLTALPQNLTGAAGVPLGKHGGVGFGEVIAGVRQDITADREAFTVVIDWGDGLTTTGNAFIDLSLASDTQHRTYSVFDVHTYTQPGTYPITVVFSENGVPEATVTSTATISGSANQQFVEHVYRDLLGRPADANGLSTWLARLDQGLSRNQFVAQLEQSVEYRQDVVTTLYLKYLHRAADPAALQMGVNFLAHGATDEQLAEILVSSHEYFALHGSSNDGFLDALFLDALNRPIDAGSKAAFEQALAAGVSRMQIAAAMFTSHEYHADVVDAAYVDLLHRHADAGGLAYWTSQLDGGATNEQLIAALAGSDEYFNQP